MCRELERPAGLREDAQGDGENLEPQVTLEVQCEGGERQYESAAVPGNVAGHPSEQEAQQPLRPGPRENALAVLHENGIVSPSIAVSSARTPPRCGLSPRALPALLLVLVATAWLLGGCGGSRRAKRVKLPPPVTPRLGWTEVGVASWYGHPYHGRTTSNGETYDMNKMTAAHKRLPFDTWVRVRNLGNGKTTQVRINDRGPFVGNRIIDLSRAAATDIQMISAGTARVRLTVIRSPRRNRRGARRPAERRAENRFDVQTGVFRNRSSAQALAGKIGRFGHRVSIEEFSLAGAKRYRVLVAGGDRKQAYARLERLKSQGFEGYVRPRGGR